MWVRRSPAEIAQIERKRKRQRYSPAGAFVLTIILMLCLAIARKLFYSRSDSLLTSPAFVPTFLIVFMLFYISHQLVGRYWLFGPRFAFPVPTQRSMICVRCHTTQLDLETRHCACGGELEPLDYWRWLDAPNQALQPTAGRSDVDV
jgi:hypothetical protein